MCLLQFDLAATPYLIQHAHPVVTVQHLPNTFAPRFKWKMVPDDVYATEVYFWNSTIQESSWCVQATSFVLFDRLAPLASLRLWFSTLLTSPFFPGFLYVLFFFSVINVRMLMPH